jgi:hypothetical protein
LKINEMTLPKDTELAAKPMPAFLSRVMRWFNNPAPSRNLSAGNAGYRLFWLGLAIRVIYITVARPYTFDGKLEDHFHFGWEMGRVAAALVGGRGYADPFVPGTGPTAWLPPLYPLLLSAVFKLFGTYSLLSGWVILVINSIFNCAIIPAVYEIAARCYSRPVAIWSAWLWTLYPAAMQYAVRWVWEMSLTCMLFTWMVVCTLRLLGTGDRSPASQRSKTALWALFGLLWGCIALSNPTLLLLLPVFGLSIVLSSHQSQKELRDAILSAIIFAACLAPWMYRNWQDFHHFIPLRDNWGAELWAGNGPGSEGFPWGNTLPLAEHTRQIELFRSMGEFQYVKMHGAMADAYIKKHPLHFLSISIKRFYFVWAGVPHPSTRHEWTEYFRECNYCLLSITGVLGLALSIKRRVQGIALFAWSFLLAPLTYYFVTPGARFRHPLEPLIAIVSVYLFQSAKESAPAQPVRERSSLPASIPG